MFTNHNNILCIEATALYQDTGVMTKANYKNLLVRNKITSVVRGGNGRKALVEWSSLPVRFQKPIIEEYGDPLQVEKNTYMDRLLEQDTEAFQFYSNYRLSNGDSLPSDVIHTYTMNASVLNAVHKTYTNRHMMRKKSGGSVRGIWSTVYEEYLSIDMTIWAHSLPSNLRKLRARIKEYIERGYESLIHGNYCNSNSVKLIEPAKQWLLARWADRVRKCATIKQLLREYTKKASQEQSWRMIRSEQALKNYLFRSDIKPLWAGLRYGDSYLKGKYTYQHTTKLPSKRDTLWYSDGTKLNYYYKYYDGGKLKVATCNVYEVMDAYSEVLLGYHISKTENHEAQHAAYKMACQRSGHRPYQIGFDGQGGHSKLKAGNFLSNLAHLAIKTQPYNGASKTIENVFSRFQQQFLKQDWFFTGMNITTKTQESRANMEFILQNKENLPTLDEVKEIYMQRREEWNNNPHPATGQLRIEMYLQSSNEKTPKIELWDMVDLFWVSRPKPLRMVAYGLSFQESGEKYTYMKYQEDNDTMPDLRWLRDNIDEKFYVKYDPSDYSFIAIYKKKPNGDLVYECMLDRKMEVHRAIQEHEEWEADYLSAVELEKITIREETRDTIEDVMRAEKMHVEDDYGMNDTPLLGINSSKKKKKKRKQSSSDIAKVQKKVSNADPFYEDENGDIQFNWREIV